MKISMLSTNDTKGGAGKATLRLHNQLRILGVDSSLFVQEKLTDLHHVIGPLSKYEKAVSSIRPTLDQIPLYITRNVNSTLSSAWVPNFNIKHLLSDKPDLFHLNWLNKGYIRIETLSRLPKPLVASVSITAPGTPMPISTITLRFQT